MRTAMTDILEQLRCLSDRNAVGKQSMAAAAAEEILRLRLQHIEDQQLIHRLRTALLLYLARDPDNPAAWLHSRNTAEIRALTVLAQTEQD